MRDLLSYLPAGSWYFSVVESSRVTERAVTGELPASGALTRFFAAVLSTC